MGTRICNDCKVEKPLNEFYKYPRVYCKECVKARVRKYQKDNPGKRKVILSRYYDSHREQVKASQVEYRLRPGVKEDRAAKAKVYRKLNHSQRIEYRREWRARNPERARAGYRRWTQRRKARVAGVEIEYFDRSEIFTRDNGACRYCGTVLDVLNWHLDHIVPIVRGGMHTRANTVAACPKCNLSKNDKLLEELGWTLHHVAIS